MLLRIAVDQAWTEICGESRDVQLKARSVMNRIDSHKEDRHLAARTQALDKLVSVKRASTNMRPSSMTPSRADSTGAVASKSRPLF